MAVLREGKLTKLPGTVKPDAKHRVVLPGSLVKKDVVYQIYTNLSGQIILDPQVTIPASELWVFKNRETVEMLDRGMAESQSGETTGYGSFTGYL